MSQSKYWIFTWNLTEEKQSEDDATRFAESILDNELRESTSYGIYQLERGDRNSRYHLQGYLCFNQRKRMGFVRSLLGNSAHVESRKGTHQQAKAYNSKEESRVAGPWMWGVEPVSQQGRRTDLEEIKEAIKAGTREITIAEEYFGQWVRYHKSFARFRTLLTPERNYKTQTIVYWGETGTGKTRKVFDEHGSDGVYPLPRSTGNAFWFDGYGGGEHDVLLIDDFYGWLPISFLLKLCDRYPMMVPIKGAMTRFTCHYIYFTSNIPWTDWYKWDEINGGDELKKAFKRRIDKVVHFTELN